MSFPSSHLRYSRVRFENAVSSADVMFWHFAVQDNSGQICELLKSLASEAAERRMCACERRVMGNFVVVKNKVFCRTHARLKKKKIGGRLEMWFVSKNSSFNLNC